MATPAPYLRIRSAAVLGGLWLCAANVLAATITVDTIADPAERDTCTLRSAIAAANTNTAVAGCSAGDPGLDTVDVSHARQKCTTKPCTTGLLSTLPTVTEDLTIDGGSSRPTIARVGAAQFGLMKLGAVTVNIQNVELKGGDALSASGGAILLDGTNLTLTGVTFTSNHASSNGGAIYAGVGSTLRVIDSTFNDNSGQTGAGISCFGATLRVSGSSFTRNVAEAHGGAISADRANNGDFSNVSISTSTFDSNSAGSGVVYPPYTAFGGGLFVRGPGPEVLDSTFVRNVSTREGAGGGGIALLIQSTSTAGRATLANVTISGNSARGDGGGLLVQAYVNLFNVTITGNVADSDGGGSGNGGGVFHDGLAYQPLPIAVQSSIIAGNFDTPNSAGPGPKHPDVSGSFESQGYNLIGTGDGSIGFSGDNHDQIGGGTQLIDPLLGPLADNGGPTQTHRPLPGSPALDKGNPDNPKREVACMETDQRGVRRPVDGDGDGVPICDAGALEVTPEPVTTTTTTIVSTTTSTIAGVSPTSTTTTSTLPGAIGACVPSQLPDDSIAGVRCVAASVRATLSGPPVPTCTCKKCSLVPRLDKLESLLGQAESATKEKSCRRKLKKARRAAKSLSAKAGSLADRQCLAPGDRATELDAQSDELARRTGALATSAFCDGR
jgi:predicted outer membrane repeat protein